MRVPNLSPTDLSNTKNEARSEETPESAHLELLYNEIGANSYRGRLDLLKYIPGKSLPLKSRPQQLITESTDTYIICCPWIKLSDALSS